MKKGWPLGKPRGPQSEEVRKRSGEAISKSMTPNVRLKISESLRNYISSLSPEEREERVRKSFRSEEAEIKRLKSVKRFFSNQSQEEVSKRLERTFQNPEAQAKKRAILTSMKPEKREEIALRIARSNRKGPSLPELSLSVNLESISPNTWEYNGSGQGSLSIGGKVPDFFKKNENKVIEVFGVYWHDEVEEHIIINHYKNFGYECLVLWEYDCYLRNIVLSKLKALNWL